MLCRFCHFNNPERRIFCVNCGGLDLPAETLLPAHDCSHEQSPLYVDVVTRLRRIVTFSATHKAKRFGKTVSLIALLFGRPTDPPMKETIIPQPDLWYYRSGKNIDFFCVGLFTVTSLILEARRAWRESAECTIPATQPFNENDFLGAISYFESVSKWKYSREPEVLLMEAVFDPQNQDLRIDSSNMISLMLGRAVEARLIKGITNLIDDLVKFARYYEHTGPVDDQQKAKDRIPLNQFVQLLLPERADDELMKAVTFIRN